MSEPIQLPPETSVAIPVVATPETRVAIQMVAAPEKKKEGGGAGRIIVALLAVGVIVVGGRWLWKYVETQEKKKKESGTCGSSGVVCGEHGTCQGNACVCHDGFSGSDCSTTNKCAATNRCSDQGKCDPATGKCVCNVGYSGVDCATKTPCAGKTCSDRGHCDPATGVCVCNAGVSGVNCEIDSQGACEGKPCGNPNGTCRVVSGVATCQCLNNYSGTSCEIPPTSDSPCTGVQCGAHGNCVVTNAEARTYQCHCRT